MQTDSAIRTQITTTTERGIAHCTNITLRNYIFYIIKLFLFTSDSSILPHGKEASEMFDILGFSETAEREKGFFDASNEVKFAHVYFAFYPYISSNN